MNERLSILIPVYNERAYLPRCLERVLAAPLPPGLDREVILVDDASTDGTSDLVRELAARHPGVVRAFAQPVNQGKGAALRRAIQEMRGQYAIFQDADLEYDPNEYGDVVRPLLDGRADVVYGSRFASRHTRRVLNYHHELGNRLLTFISNWLTGLNLTDMETCYKAFRAGLLKDIPIRSNRFGIEPEITAKIAKRRCRVYEVPISYFGRGYEEGKKIGWKDGVSALWTMLKFRLVDDCYQDSAARQTLTDLAHVRRFNRWTADRLKPSLGRRVLDVGSGMGSICRYLPARDRLTVSDNDETYVEHLQDVYRDNALVEARRVDLEKDEDFDALAGRYDTVVCVNVLQLLDDDAAAVRRMARALEPGGRLVLLVPNAPALFGEYDRWMGHRRRYRAGDVRRLLNGAGLDIEHLGGFNRLGAVGWWFNSVLFRRRHLARFQVRLYDRLVPVIRRLEPLLPLPGLSLLVVARKGAAP